MLKICSLGHITGTRTCRCGNNTTPLVHDGPIPYAIDKRVKRQITQNIRLAGGMPVADLKRLF